MYIVPNVCRTHDKKEDCFGSSGCKSERTSSHPSTPYHFLVLEEAEEKIW